MKLLVIFLVIGIALAEEDLQDVLFEKPEAPDNSDTEQYMPWKDFVKEYNRIYSGVEYYGRKLLFFTNRAAIKKQNDKFKKGESLFMSEVNDFTDWTSEELNVLNALKPPSQISDVCNGTIYEPESNAEVPEYVNWNEEGLVTAVRNQGRCGSDYAISAIGALESQFAIQKKNELHPLSVQNLIDCSSGEFGNRGCFGGLPSLAYDYIKANGINTEDNYPYSGINDKCRSVTSESDLSDKIEGCQMLPPDDEEALRIAVATFGPVSISYKVTPDLFFYKSGIYDGQKCQKHVINHGMLLVGYGTDPDTKRDFWLIKNSWGANWGENGYFRSLRNESNHCGIASLSIIPTL